MCGYCVEILALDPALREDAGGLGIGMTIQEEDDPARAVALAVETGYEGTAMALARLAEAAVEGIPVGLHLRGQVAGALAESRPRLCAALDSPADEDALVDAAHGHLEDFTAWWFGGGGAGGEPDAAAPAADSDRLWTMTPATLASLAVLRRYHAAGPRDEGILLDLVAGIPVTVPDFDGCDLWIQRRAMLDLFDRHGVDAMLHRMAEIRRFLWAYLLRRRSVPRDVVRRLDRTFGAGWPERLPG